MTAWPVPPRPVMARTVLSLSLLAALLPLEAAQAQTAGNDSAASAQSAPFPFAPPLGRDLTLTQSDERLLANGTTATFRSIYRLRFDADGADYRVTLQRTGTECDGSAHICNLYHARMQPPVGQTSWPQRRFRLSPARQIDYLDGPLAIDVRRTGQIDRAVEMSEAAAAGGLIRAELMEVLRFAGEAPPPLASESEDGLRSGDGVGLWTVEHADPAHTAIVEAEALPPRAATEPPMRQITRTLVDRHTGLVHQSSRQSSIRIGTQTTILSTRMMQLAVPAE